MLQSAAEGASGAGGRGTGWDSRAPAGTAGGADVAGPIFLERPSVASFHRRCGSARSVPASNPVAKIKMSNAYSEPSFSLSPSGVTRSPWIVLDADHFDVGTKECLL